MATWAHRSGLEIERTEDAVLVRDVDGGVVHELTGEQVAAFEWAERSQEPVPAHLREPMAALGELGLVTSHGWSRRRVLTGAAAAAVGLAAAIGARAFSRGEAVDAQPDSGSAASPARSAAKPTTTLDLTYQLIAAGTGGQLTGTQKAVGRGGYAVTVGAASGKDSSSGIDLPTPVSTTDGAAAAARSGGGSAGYHLEGGAGGSGYDLKGGGGSGYELKGAGGSGYELKGAGGSEYNLSGGGSTGYNTSGAGGSGYDLKGSGGSGYDLHGGGSTGYDLKGSGGSGYDTSGGGRTVDAGDHGVVVISYRTPRNGVTGKGGSVSTSGDTTYHRFDRSGTFTIA